MKRPDYLPSLVALTVLFAAPLASAEDNDIAELKAMVREMRQTIDEQNARIAALENQQAVPKTKPPATTSIKPAEIPAGTKRPVEGLPMDAPVGMELSSALHAERSTVRDADTFGDLQQAAPRPNNTPLDPDLKGFINIPGTDTLLKIGGSARVDTIVDFANNGHPNQFVPSTIPVPGEPGWDGGLRSTLQAKATRLSLELRRPVAFGDTLRVYSEYDFYDDSTSSALKFRARHFYGQAWNFLIGHTFTAFMDVDAFPDVVDFQGPNGSVNRRQPQLRYTHPISEGECATQIFASIELPESKIDTDTSEFAADSSVVSPVPDGVVGIRRESPLGHLQATAIFRDLAYEADDGPDDNVTGWGVSLSGSLNVFEKDKLSAQVTYGEGIARYINDLSGEDLDAAIDDGDLEAIPVIATMAGYTHHWSEHWRSTLAGGYVQVDAPNSLGGFAIDNTLYGSANIMWQPTPSFRTGLEYLYGHKETLDGSEGEAQRVNFVIRYDLVR